LKNSRKSEKVDIAVVRLPRAGCEKVFEHDVAERPDGRALLPPFWKLSYGEKIDQWER
jgi:hypothetical protein